MNGVFQLEAEKEEEEKENKNSSRRRKRRIFFSNPLFALTKLNSEKSSFSNALSYLRKAKRETGEEKDEKV